MVIDFEAIAFVEDTIAYASAFQYNGLYKINTVTNEVEFISLFMDEDVNAVGLHSFAVYSNNKVYFIPASGNRISILNTDDETIDSIEIPNKVQTEKYYEKYYYKSYKFIYAHEYKENIYLIPSIYPGIIKLDIKNNTISVIDDWVSDNVFLYRKAYGIIDDVLYIASRDNGNVLILDFETEECRIKVLENTSGFISAVVDKKDLILLGTDGKSVIRLNVDNDTIEEYQIKVEKFKGKNILFSKIYKYNDKYYLVPNQSNMLLEMDENGTIAGSENTILNNADVIWFMFETFEDMYFRVKRSNETIRYRVSKHTNDFTQIEFIADEKISVRSKQMCKISSEKRNIICENDNFPLQNFIEGFL